MNVKLGILTINYKRPHILRLWCAQIKRLRRDLGIDFPAVVVSDDEDIPICKAYDIVHITQQNKPVTEKWNTAIGYLKTVGATNCLILGSDDIVSSGFIRTTLDQCEQGKDLIGIKTIYFYCGQGLDKGKMVVLRSKQFLGTGKTVSSRVLDQCDWRPWGVERDWGMDAIASKTFTKYARERTVIDGMVVDVKGRMNLNSYHIWGKRLPSVPAKEFHDILSEEELEILLAL